MHLTINSKTLSAALAKAKAVATSANPIAAAQCILLSAAKKELTLSACNLDLQIKTSAPCSVKKAGGILISAKRFCDVIDQIDGEITLSAEGLNLTIARGKTIVKRVGLPVEDALTLEGGKELDSIAGTQRLLKEKLGKVKGFQADDDTRFTLMGVAIAPVQGRAALVATNGQTMRLEFLSEQPLSQTPIIPTTGVQLLWSLCGDSENKVQLSFAENTFSATSENWHLVGKLIQGQYPPAEQIIPDRQKAVHEIRCSREGLLKSVRLACTTHDAKDSIGAVRLDGDKDSLRVSAITADVGEAQDEVEGGSYGLDAPTAFKGEYLKTMAESFDSKDLILKMEAPFAPALIEDENGVCLVFAIRIR